MVCGRAKEVNSVAGRNVFPAEIERVAAQVKGVREGAVVAVGTNEGAVRPGLVIAAEFRGADESGARSELVRRVASECGVVPSDVMFLAPGALPRTSSGKLRRLEGQTQPGSREPVTAMTTPSIEDYRALLDKVFDEQVTAWTAEAEATERFPRQLIEHLGRSGIFARLRAGATRLGGHRGRGQPARFGHRDSAAVRQVRLPAYHL